MPRNILFFIAVAWILNGVLIFFAPNTFYETVPGVKMMGPFNLHFIRDVALVFFTSGLAIGYGAWRYNKGVAFAALAWHVAHALFHVQLWVARDAPLDLVAFSNFSLLLVPTAVAVVCGVLMKRNVRTAAA